ncbi:MAG: hypothetical protein AUK44_03910 [Porphyromonadaceae bacterium CG2_30_38_12]|nr:MAG: hypothetical protein AUK44_03910 [Porphyromonadaceae bacterium CG2_30_38_12]
MKKLNIVFQLFLLTVSASAGDILSRTNVFWGTDGGNVFPGVSVPFGMVKLGPEVRAAWQPTSGYVSDEPIVGFSHTRTSGTGGNPRYGNFLFIPQVDSVRLKEFVKYAKLNEAGYPGYYTVTLKDKNSYIKVELTADKKVGYHRYTFTKKYSESNALNANVVIDVSNTLTRIRNGMSTTYWTNGYVNILSNKTLQASISCEGGWGGLNPYTIYCYIEFDQPFTQSGIWLDGEIIKRKGIALTNYEKSLKRFGAMVSFPGNSGMEVNCKVGVSYLSYEAAMQNLRSTNNNTFDQALANAEKLWTEKLNKIQTKGGSVMAQQLFRSALRNTMLMPTDVTGEVPGWNPNVPHFWDFYCVWDVFRATMPLYSLIYPETQRRIISCMLDIYDKKGWLPDAWIADDYAMMQGGSNADVVLADAVVKKLGGFDVKTALQAVRKDAELQSENPRIKGRFTNDYKKYGFVLPESAAGSVSRTLEYAYNDFCIAEIATSAGDNPLSEKYKNQSLNVFNLFYPEHKMFWAKDSAQHWKPDFTPVSKRKDTWNDPYFYEGGSQIYSTYVPHAMQTLIDKHGGSKQYIAYLDKLFDSGVFSIENEPEFLIPYQYIYAGDYPSTARRVHNILTKMFQPGAAGIPGQDDSGSMSAWYVFSAMGFFPVAGQDLYLIGTPLFEETTIVLEGKKQFRIIAKNRSSQNIYITKATLNGKSLDRAWFRHTEIAKGGKLVLEMSATPNDWGKENLPESVTEK